MIIKLCDTFYYKVKNGDTIENLSHRFNAEKCNILRNNLDIDLYNGEWLCVKQNEYFVHIVKPCESLEKISNIYKVEQKEIISKNNLISTKLFIGQKLKIYN